MRSINQHIIILISFAVLHFLNLLPDIQHDIYEIVQFCQTLAFCRFNHQCTVNREGEGRSMITIVHQTFGNIIFRDACFFMYFPTLQNHFVSYETIGSPIDNSIRIFQASSQIISIQDGDLSCLRQSLCTHHADISIRDRQNTCTTKWGS